MVKDYKMMDFNRKEDPIEKGTYKSVNTDAFTYMLINGMQEQQKLIEELQKQVTALQKFNEKLQNSENILQIEPNTIPVQKDEKFGKKQLTYDDLSQNSTINLSQNVPNPLVYSTKIQYSIPNNVEQAKLVFTDINGNFVKSIRLQPGIGVADVSLDGVIAGVYTYTLVVDGRAKETKKMVVK